LRTEKEVLAQFEDWAQANDLIRAAVLTSSRVKPNTTTDFLSDYDIELYVTELQSFQQNDDWLNTFGPIMVRWPYKPRSTGNEGGITRLVLFKDGVRIDFQITDKLEIEPDAYQDVYQVLIDKDNLTGCLNKPTDQEYIVKAPTQEEFETLVSEFWWAAIYVPKYLWRDEVPFAKYMLDNIMRYEYLQSIVEWYIGSQNGWSVNTGVHGRWFKKYLDEETWVELESTYTGTKIEENQQAFFRFIALFRRLATVVGHQLDYGYPLELDKEVTEYCCHIFERDRDSS
jgi:aminoglycoside 6-adenylyltransferase